MLCFRYNLNTPLKILPISLQMRYTSYLGKPVINLLFFPQPAGLQPEGKLTQGKEDSYA